MILHTGNQNDVAFVAKVIREHKLEPTPVTGFHSKDTYWQENERWRRVVEEYPWGCVMFIDDKERGMHATVVTTGKFDLATGKSSHGMIPMAWYHDMVSELKQLTAKTVLQIPPCLGFHECDHVCDGGIHPQTKQAEPECYWVKQCQALQSFSLNQKREPEEVLRGKSPEAIIQMLTRMLEHKPSGQAHVAAMANASAARGNKPHTEYPNTSLPDFVKELAREVAEACGVCLHLTNSVAQLDRIVEDVAAKAGDLLVVDRSTNSDYVSVYKARDGRPRAKAICSFRLRRRIGGFRVQLPLPKDSQLLEPIVSADVGLWKDGAFQTVVNDVIPGQRRMDHIKNIMVELASK